jgi:hypothetical protein
MLDKWTRGTDTSEFEKSLKSRADREISLRPIWLQTHHSLNERL